MKRFRLKIGVDVDDVLLSCNEYALERVNKRLKLNPPLHLEDITNWGLCQSKVDLRLDEFDKEDFYRKQPVLPGAKEFIQELCKLADVFLITAVRPRFMGARVQRLKEEFPEVPEENIIMGARKDLLQLDMLLDDGAHNIQNSISTYPVLRRWPWNNHMTGCYSVNQLGEFISLVKMILESNQQDLTKAPGHKVFVLVGTSGSGKTSIIEPFVNNRCLKKIPSYTCRAKRDGEVDGKDYHFVSKEKFLEMKAEDRFFETTCYAGSFYGTGKEQFEKILETSPAAIAMDICGAIAVKKAFPDQAVLVFVDRPKEKILASILERRVGDNEKIQRILSLGTELKNESLCDETINNHGSLEYAVEQMARIIYKYEHTFF